MTWRVCSPPWPGRQNLGSWPGRRQCGLPSAGQPPRPASHPLPGVQGGAGGPEVSGSSSFPSQAGHGAGRGGGRAGQRLRGLHRRPAQPHSATGARHGGGAGPAQLRRAPARHGREVVGRARHAPAQQPARPRAAPLDEPGSGSRPADPDAELQAQPGPGHPVTVPPGRPAARSWPTRRVRSRRCRGIRACPRGTRESTAPASRPGRRTSPPCTRTCPGLKAANRRSVPSSRVGVLSGHAR